MRATKRMSTYNVSLDNNVLTIGFGVGAQNDQIVKDAQTGLKAVNFPGGEVLKVTGPASLPVAFVIAHHVNHLYQAIAVFDPKLGKYVVAIAHGDQYVIGDLID